MSQLLRIVNNIRDHKLFRLTPARMILLGFSGLILLGAVVLSLPFSSSSGQSIGWTDALFTSASAVCVTGLVVADTNLQWSVLGKTVILLLIQIGALGIMSVVTVFSVFTGKRLGLMDRLTIQESLNHFTVGGIVKTFYGILGVTLLAELTGAVIFFTELLPVYGASEAAGKSIFHSVSAFCNAGFDLFGASEAPFSSILAFQERPLFLLTTSLLIILGGLGFIVWNDIAVHRRFSKLTLHSKVVLATTGILLVLGTLLFWMTEAHNPQTLGALSGPGKPINAFFLSVTARTAGFSAVAPAEMNDASNFLTMLLMFIGGAPGSAAGGIKVTTFSILMLTAITIARGKSDVQIFERRLPAGIITKAIAVAALAMFTIITVTLLLLIDNQVTFLEALYEAISAFANVGLSTGITPELSALSKYVLILTMLVGRIGPFTAMVAFTAKRKNQTQPYRYPEGKITTG
ncbi:MAG: potassium transporter TrkG [Eubacteriales bacterium]|nr:potassium transporter TrkG [Eubacteriales bacterium]